MKGAEQNNNNQGRIEKIITVTSSLSEIQTIRLIGHIGFPITFEIPNEITFPPSIVIATQQKKKQKQEAEDSYATMSGIGNSTGDVKDGTKSNGTKSNGTESNGAGVTHGGTKSIGSNSVRGSRLSSSSIPSTCSVLKIPIVNHSRYTLIVRISGLEQTSFVTLPNCSDVDRSKCVSLQPLSVSYIEVRHLPSRIGPAVLSSLLSIEISSPFLYTQTLPAVTFKGYGIDSKTCGTELHQIQQWYHNGVVLRSPRNFQVPLANNERDDLQWVAVIDGYDTTCNKYILKFLSTTGLEKKCIRQPNYDLKEIRVSSNNKEGAVPIYGGEGVVANIIGGTLYDVRLTNQHNVVMDGLTKNQISKSTTVQKTMNEQKGNQEVEEKATINTSLDKDVIRVGDLVHVLLPIGTQVMAVPRFYVKGILMKINQSSNKTTNLQTINVKINKEMCRNLPLRWLHLGETAVLPELGSTVFVCYHPPNDIPNITVPWLISKWRTDELQKLKKLKEEANALKDVKDEGHIQKSSSSRSSSTESQHPKLNLIYLSSTTNKKLKNEFMFYHDDDKDHEKIIIRNNGLKKISIRITTSVGYQWSRNVDNTARNKEKKKERKENNTENNMENSMENSMETEKEIKDRNQTIVLTKGNFIAIKVTWLRKNERIVSDIGKYSKRRERASRNGSTAVDISMTPPSSKPVPLSLSRSPLSKTPKQVFF